MLLQSLIILVGVFAMWCVLQVPLDRCSMPVIASSESIRVENCPKSYLVIFEYEYEDKLYHGHYYSDTVVPSSIEIKINKRLPYKYEISPSS